MSASIQPMPWNSAMGRPNWWRRPAKASAWSKAPAAMPSAAVAAPTR